MSSLAAITTTQSDSLKAIAPALLKAQKAIGVAVKNANNPHFHNNFANVEAVIDAVKGPLNDNGITFLQFGAPAGENSLGLTTTLLHTSGEFISGTLTMPLQKADPQGTGSAITYARRYSLAAVLGLKTEDDDAEGAVTHAKESKPAGKRTSMFPGR
jgi:hypothetical protein